MAVTAPCLLPWMIKARRHARCKAAEIGRAARPPVPGGSLQTGPAADVYFRMTALQAPHVLGFERAGQQAELLQ